MDPVCSLRFWSKQICLWLGIFALMPALVASELPQYSSRLWRVEDGLPHNAVRAVVQTDDGYLWVGTDSGLARFDGVRFHHLDFPELAGATITALCESRDGTLWIGTEKGLLFLSEGKLSSFQGLGNDAVREIHEDDDGVLWIGFLNDIVKLKNGRIERPYQQALDRDVVWSICVDDAGKLWAAGSSLKWLSEGETKTFTSADGLIEGGQRRVYPGKDGSIWIGTTKGLSRWQNGDFTSYPKGSGPSAIVGTICEDRHGGVWVGTYEGVWRLFNGRFVKEPRGEGLDYRVNALCEDREGNLWVGSDEGLSRLTIQPFETYNKRNGLTHNSTRAVCAGEDGSVWIGVWGGGLAHLRNGEVTTYGMASGLASDFVYSVCTGRDGSVWIGLDYGHGLNRLSDGTVTHFGRLEGLIDPVITAIHEDRAGNVWIGATTGLNRFQDGTFTRYTTASGLSDNQVNVIGERDDGTLFVGTESGLMHWNGELMISEHCAGIPVLAIHEDHDQTLWIGTRGAGLVRLRKDDESFTYTRKHGFMGDSIYAILDDDRGHLWVHSGRGIFRVSKQELDNVARGIMPSMTPVRFGRTDGIVSSGQYRKTSQPAACKSTDGRLWFRTTQGVVVVDPARIKTNELPPPVIIEELNADKQPFATANLKGKTPGANGLSTSNRKRETLSLPPGPGEMTFRYTALSFTASEKIRFKYKLEGLDADWVDAGTRREAFYNRVPPGNYTFRVIACNNDGFWNESGASVRFTLRPYFWETWWFKSIGAMACVSVVAVGARYATRRRMQWQLQRLEQQHAVEKERRRIAQDMHDDLGARLTEILLLSERPVAENLPDKHADDKATIAKAAREMADRLDAIVWAVEPRNDSLGNVAEYVYDYTIQFLGASAIRCRLDVPDDLPKQTVTSEARHHLLMIVKEALNNIAKYSEASEVWFRLHVQQSTLIICLEDNGIGFSQDEVSSLGNGLINMEKRIRIIGGRLDLQSTPGKGTRIQVELPLHG